MGKKEFTDLSGGNRKNALDVVDCPDCNGEDNCKSCHGTGKVTKTKLKKLLNEKG